MMLPFGIAIRVASGRVNIVAFSAASARASPPPSAEAMNVTTVPSASVILYLSPEPDIPITIEAVANACPVVEELPEGTVGFVYLITNLTNNKKTVSKTIPKTIMDNR